MACKLEGWDRRPGLESEVGAGGGKSGGRGSRSKLGVRAGGQVMEGAARFAGGQRRQGSVSR
ncbi:hypothetical protein BKM31_00375 [[Actinomadura] parvosata subsp. kistnae]|uniref:Uncharacterized protein n=1 Tax=[Actinomadura] parvosata subsp. kistnae TaxID=1909395 RepID=A0A1U9ZQE7_9ACTN|nr:hypothetical protein BKM31_00375 [Nonomuraea sp. ATCC 55076]